MNRKPRQILDLEIDEISLVDKGANQHAIVTIAKSANGDKENYMDIFDEQGMPVDQDELELGDVVYDADGQAYELSDDSDEYDDDEVEKAFYTGWGGKAGYALGRGLGETYNAGASAAGATRAAAGRAGGAARKAGASLKASGEKTGKFARQKKYDVVGPSVGPRTSTHMRNRKIGYGVGGGLAGAGAAGGGAYVYDRNVRKSYGEELREELSKALTDADRDDVISKAFDQIEYLAESAEIAKAAAEEERQIRLEQEYFEIAKSYDLPLDSEALGGVLMRMAEVLPYEDCEIIGKALAYASEATDYIFDEYGAVGGGDNSDVLTQVNAIVDETVSKSAGYGREELTAEFFAQNPAAYDDYLNGY